MPEVVQFKKSALKDLKHLDEQLRLRILKEVYKKLQNDGPQGEKLKGSLEGLYRIAYASYRVIYALIPSGKLVLRIRHRKDVYKK